MERAREHDARERMSTRPATRRNLTDRPHERPPAATASGVTLAVVAANHILFRLRWHEAAHGVRLIDVDASRSAPEPSGEQRGTLRFGSLASKVDVLIDHPSIAPMHAEIEADSESIWIRDLGSDCGTFVEGIEVESARLLPGQTLRLGDVALRIESACRPAVAAPSIASAIPGQSGSLVDRVGEDFRVEIPGAMLDLSHREFRERWADIGERFFLERKLAKHSRNVSRVSREIDLARTYTHKLIKKYGL